MENCARHSTRIIQSKTTRKKRRRNTADKLYHVMCMCWVEMVYGISLHLTPSNLDQANRKQPSKRYLSAHFNLTLSICSEKLCILNTNNNKNSERCSIAFYIIFARLALNWMYAMLWTEFYNEIIWQNNKENNNNNNKQTHLENLSFSQSKNNNFIRFDSVDCVCVRLQRFGRRLCAESILIK